MNPLAYQMIILVGFIFVLYFVLLRPQQKRDRETANMRNSVQVGDEIVTIGGICGKVVKTKDESIVIQVGADKTKLEFKRWAISSVEEKSDAKVKDAEPVEEKKSRPKRLGRKAESMEEEVAEAVETADAAVDAAATSAAETVEDIAAEIPSDSTTAE